MIRFTSTMMKKTPKFHVSTEELVIESGEGAPIAEVKKFADTISLQWKEGRIQSHSPVLLLLGGFQGSGKTTTAQVLNTDSEFIVISPDEVRYILFTAEIPFSKSFVVLVNAIKFELLKRALRTGSSVIIDQALTPERVRLVEQVVHSYPHYQVTSVFLYAPEEVLRKRVGERPQLAGRYKGTVEELKASMKIYAEWYGDPLRSGYDIVIDTTNSTPFAVAQKIKEYITCKM
ncbi:hypothetical protein C5B42_04360 [Candidatus Cerribacteria bacterium 'Amazon FNV 2010 28 9']|uniref:UDP-N-acetylglucosamine kinase n=1 Tax=Candidatus Cerribacteria bacterium 'Amazon FNV 2010 28 9' TaxID=2081795 RepID=A0A317JP72_9BACT|nr:MAG: hypothetical protein C5B42_04360 [Candidatus Cerribacteria bacterium 'Amazon FNV 2010 28 9']